MKMLITTAHKREIEFLRCIKGADYYINRGRSAIEYYQNIKLLVKKNRYSAIVNFGIAGTIDRSLPIGKIVHIRKIFYIDSHSLKILAPVIDIGNIEKRADNLLTLTDLNKNLNKNADYYGSILDLEGYFVALAAREMKIPVFIFKVISDYNERFENIGDNIIKDASNSIVSKYIPKIEYIIENEFRKEFYYQYRFYNKQILTKITEENKKKHLTFTNRQYLYKKLLIGSNTKKKGTHKIERIYIENEVWQTEIGKKFVDHFPHSKIINIDNYLKYFSYPGKNYYESKDKMNIFLAKKRGNMLKATPEKYGLPGTKGYAMTSMFNCLYDCEYCYLSGYFKSGDMVIFTNYDDMIKEIDRIKSKEKNIIIYAGDFSDSLLFDNITKFTDYFYNYLKNNPDVSMEIRTKRGNINNLLRKQAIDNLIIAVSISPDSIIERYEHETMRLKERIDLLKTASDAGYNIGIRIDPILKYEPKEKYSEILIRIIESVDISKIHSIGIGTLRATKELYKNILYRRGHNEILKGLSFERGMYRYNESIRGEYYKALKEIVAEYNLLDRFYITMD
jgi:spore photoproduct lyase